MVARISSVALAEPEHQARLGEHAGAVALRVREHVERLAIARARVAHRVREPLDRLDVLREHLDAGIDHGLDVGEHALEIGRQRLDRSARDSPP